MRAREFLPEYASYTKAKQEIIAQIQGMDTRDKEMQSLIDEIYTTLHSVKVTDRFTKAVTPALQAEYADKKILQITSKMARTTRLTVPEKKAFLKDLAADTVLDTRTLTKIGHYGIEKDLCMGKHTSFQMFLEFAAWGKGDKAAGAGEHALAILSKGIFVPETGDIVVSVGRGEGRGTSGIAVELKVAESESGKGSGRLGEGGVHPNSVIKILKAFPEVDEQILQTRPSKSLNVFNFVTMINNIRIPNEAGEQEKLTTERRTEIGKAVFEQRFGSALTGPLVQTFAQVDANEDAVTREYIRTNFDWYKDSEMGGNWQVMVSMAFGKNNSFIVCKTGKNLINLINAGALFSNKPSIIASAARPPEVFYQPNPRPV